MIAGAADEIVQAGALAAEDDDAVAGEVEAVVVREARLAGGGVEANDPDVLLLQLFEGADEIDDAGDAEVLCGSGAGFDGYGAERGGAALGEQDAIDAGAVGYAEQSAEVLGVFDSVEGEKEASRAGEGRLGREKVFEGEELLGADDGDDSLMRGGLGAEGELIAGLGVDADAELAAEGDELDETRVLALASHENVVKMASAGAQSLFDRVQAVQKFHVL
jgi:hypothetical protein